LATQPEEDGETYLVTKFTATEASPRQLVAYERQKKAFNTTVTHRDVEKER